MLLFLVIIIIIKSIYIAQSG